MEDKEFKLDEIELFIHDHIQSKIEHGELERVFNFDTDMTLEEQFDLYKNTLLEGIINGIVMCGGKVEGIEL